MINKYAEGALGELHYDGSPAAIVWVEKLIQIDEDDDVLREMRGKIW